MGGWTSNCYGRRKGDSVTEDKVAEAMIGSVRNKVRERVVEPVWDKIRERVVEPVWDKVGERVVGLMGHSGIRGQYPIL